MVRSLRACAGVLISCCGPRCSGMGRRDPRCRLPPPKKKMEALDALTQHPPLPTLNPLPPPLPPHPRQCNGRGKGNDLAPSLLFFFFPSCCFKASLPGCRGFKRPSLCIRCACCDEPLKGVAATPGTEIASALQLVWAGVGGGGGGVPYSPSGAGR